MEPCAPSVVRVNQDLRPPHRVRNRKSSWACVPQWLLPLLGARESEIIFHAQARFLAEDQEGNRYPNHMQWIESPVGTMLIDSRRRCILS